MDSEPDTVLFVALDKFPDPMAESIGQFQVVDSGGKFHSPRRTGVLRFSENRASLDLSWTSLVPR